MLGGGATNTDSRGSFKHLALTRIAQSCVFCLQFQWSARHNQVCLLESKIVMVIFFNLRVCNILLHASSYFVMFGITMFMLRYTVKVKFNRTSSKFLLIFANFQHNTYTCLSWKYSKSFEVDLRVIHKMLEQNENPENLRFHFFDTETLKFWFQFCSFFSWIKC